MFRRPVPEKPGPGQESVWDYPRPPALRPCKERIRVVLGSQTILETQGAYEVLETSHPPTYYLPPDDFAHGVLRPAEGSSFCEWKGAATYFDLVTPERIAKRCAWAYPSPTANFKAIAGYVALYCHAVDACYVGDEKASPQPGNFYGGWVTSRVVGPFKGIPGSFGW